MSDMAATSIPRYRDKGWIEFMAFLVCNINADGSPQTPRIDAEMVGQCGQICTRGEARRVAKQLQEAADLVEAWIPYLPEKHVPIHR